LGKAGFEVYCINANITDAKGVLIGNKNGSLNWAATFSIYRNLQMMVCVRAARA
jgi:hypothetical protein